MSAPERAGAKGVARAIGRLAEGIALAMPDAVVEARGDGVVVVRGRGVRERLRWPAGVLR